MDIFYNNYQILFPSHINRVLHMALPKHCELTGFKFSITIGLAISWVKEGSMKNLDTGKAMMELKDNFLGGLR